MICHSIIDGRLVSAKIWQSLQKDIPYHRMPNDAIRNLFASFWLLLPSSMFIPIFKIHGVATEGCNPKTQWWFYCWISDNIENSFLEIGQFIAQSKDPDEVEPLDRPVYNQVFADITTSFTILIGIFFPSVTGTGMNLEVSSCYTVGEKWSFVLGY